MQPLQEREAKAAEIAGTVAGVVDVLFTDLRGRRHWQGKALKQGQGGGQGQGPGKVYLVSVGLFRGGREVQS